MPTFLIDPPPGRGIRSAAPVTLYCTGCETFMPIEGAAKHLTTYHPGEGTDIRITTRRVHRD